MSLANDKSMNLKAQVSIAGTVVIPCINPIVPVLIHMDGNSDVNGWRDVSGCTWMNSFGLVM
jgi:hypothetical protein